MKKYYIALLVLIVAFGLAFLVPQASKVFGGGDGTKTGGSTGTGMAGKNCGNCSGTYNPSMGSLGVGQWKDTNNDGKLSSGDKVNSGGGGGGGGGGGAGGGGGGGSVPQACTFTIAPSVVELGTSTIALSWSPTPKGKVSLTRSGKKVTVPDNATSYSDTIKATKTGKYTYTVSYTASTTTKGKVKGVSTDQSASLVTGASQVAGVTSHGAATPGGAAGGYSGGTGNWGSGGGSSGGGGGGGGGGSGGGGGGSTNPNLYSCTATLRVVTKIVECNDGKDNTDTEDSLIDQQDPGCHTDGNPGNTKSYNPDDTSEVNAPADLVPTITTVTKQNAKKPIRVTASAKNVGGAYANTNALVYGWRDTSGTIVAPKCGKNNKNCFLENGHLFLRLNSFNRSYKVGQTRTDDERAFNPPVKGKYEVCAIADYVKGNPAGNIAEGVAGEANNNTCKIVTVDDPSTPTTPTTTPTVTGPTTLIATPGRIRKGNIATLTWNTGGRTDCTITGTNGDIIDLTGSASASSSDTPPITAETKYTLLCTADNSSAETTIKLIPQYQEF